MQNSIETQRVSVRPRLAAALLIVIVSILLLPIGIVIRTGLASSPGEPLSSVIAPDELSDSVAAIAAEFRVGESGASTYAIPLLTTAGTAGVAPKLSLQYSSQGGEGPIGRGWTIGGLSAISRCRATREAGDFIVNGAVTDGDPAPINYTASDRYCLDGQRLLSSSNAVCPSVLGMTAQGFFTEIQSYQRVCAYSPAGGSAGVAFFTVNRKDGSTSWYGDRDNSVVANRTDGYVNSTAPGKEAFALSWAQTRFQDSTGNYIDFIYAEGVAPESQGEHLISKVRYTGKVVLPGQTGAASAPYAEVVFNYTENLFDTRAYVAGGLIRSRRRLESIGSSVDHTYSGNFTALRHYALTYQRGRIGQVLTSMQECRDSTLTVCVAPTTFEWSAARANEADTNLFQTFEQTAAIPNGSLTKFEGMKFGDIDGDGRQDMVWLKDGSSGEACPSKTVNLLYSRLNANGSPTLANAGTVFCAPNGLYWNPQDYSWFLFDYDGDGKDDYFQRTDTVWIGYRATGNAAQPFDTAVNLLAELSQPIPSGADKYAEPQQADLNGDGLIDLVYPSGGALVARIMERGGSYGFRWGAPRTVSLLGDGCTSGPCYTVMGLYRKNNYQQLNDFNADARSDLIVNVQATCGTGSGPPPGGSGPPGTVIPGPREIAPPTGELQGTGGQQGTTVCSIGKMFAVESLTATTVVLKRYADGVVSPEWPYSFSDINGDGLTDVVFMGTSEFPSLMASLNTGIGFVANGDGVINATAYKHAQVLDVNGDGRADLVYPDGVGHHFKARYGLASGMFRQEIDLGNTLIGCPDQTCIGSRSHQFIDIDGDGNAEYMRIKWDNDSSSPVAFSRANAEHRFIPRDVLTRVTNGYGAQTDIAYAPLTLKDLYRPDNGTRNSAVNWGRGAPVQDVFGPMYVTHRVSSTSPQNGDPAARSTLHYRYNGAKMQAGGRGFLGFREVLTIDPNQTGGYVTTRSKYAQSFPFTGLPLETSKWAAINSLYAAPGCLSAAPVELCFAPRTQPGIEPVGTGFSQSQQMWEAIADAGTGFLPGAQTPILPFTMGTVEAVADPYTATQTSYVTTAFTHAGFGNVGQTSVDTFAGTSTTPVSTVITNNTYSDDPTHWRLGRLTASTVTHRRPGKADVVRATSFAYAMAGPVTGLLNEERIQPGGSALQDLRKAYTLDDYGNRVASYLCNNAVATCRSAVSYYNMWDYTHLHRYSRQEYDARGRYPTRSIELLRPANASDVFTTLPVEKITAQVLDRDAFGNAIEAVDINGVRSAARFGILGRPYYAWKQTDPSGTGPNAGNTVGVVGFTTYRWCNSGTGAVTCPARARFRSKTVATASPTLWTYHDVLGREVLKVTQTFNAGIAGKDAAGVCTEYDAVGRAHRVSTPFFLSGNAGGEPDGVANVCGATGHAWSKTEFDVLGRPVKAIAPDLSFSTMAYNGSTTTATNARGHTKVETKNALGELLQVNDNAGLVTSYAYNAAGNLTSVGRDAGRGAIVSSMTYDALGRKVSMTDPDAGFHDYTYNAAGELLSETDGAGSWNESRYDFRGRVTWRGSYAHSAAGPILEHSSVTDYDTAPNGAGQERCTSSGGFSYASWQGQSGMQQDWARCNAYDTMGRAIAGSTIIDGVTYTSAAVLDTLGRARLAQDPSGKWLKTDFGTRGHALRICEGASGSDTAACAPGAASTYYEAHAADAFGNIVHDTRGGSAAMQSFRQYDPLTGRLAETCAGADATNCQIMRDRYIWDAVGNLSWRDRKDYAEQFAYDSVDRLVYGQATRIGATSYPGTTGTYTDWFHYDKLGNVCGKALTGVSGSNGLLYAGRAGCGLTSGQQGGIDNASATQSPHQVLFAGNNRYTYDAHGNQTFADSALGDSHDRTIRYTAADQAHEIFKGSAAAPMKRARFWYDPSGARYKREDTGSGIVGTRRTLYVANMEIVSENGTTTYKRYIGGVLVQNVANGIAANRYLFQDHQGSVVKATNEAGTVLEGGGFNAFGERRVNGSATALTTTGLASTNRGYTGHEMLDGLDVIHMNGRIYDPTLARFLQPDPVIQAPDNPQNWNAYTYVFNNPYRYTDPTGMIGLEERQWLGTIVSIVVSTFAPQIGAALYGATLAANAVTIAIIAAGGAISGGITGGSQGALMGAFTSVLGLAGGGNAFASAFVGGVSSALQGGNFGSSFLSAGVVALVVPGINGNISGRVGRVIAKALLGGTVSVATGGKFVNGAAMAAMQATLTSDPRASREESACADGLDPKELERIIRVKKVSDRIDQFREDHPDRTIPLTKEELSVLVDDTFHDLMYYQADGIEGNYKNLSSYEFLDLMRGSRGDTSTFINWNGDVFNISGMPSPYSGIHNGGDINYMMQGMSWAARGAPRGEMHYSIALWNGYQFGEDVGGGNWSTRNLQQISRAKLWADFGYQYFMNKGE